MSKKSINFRFGNLIPTSPKNPIYYLSETIEIDDSQISAFEKAMRNAANNPKDYQFATSNPFLTQAECDKEMRRKEKELINNGYSVIILTVKL